MELVRPGSDSRNPNDHLRWYESESSSVFERKVLAVLDRAEKVLVRNAGDSHTVAALRVPVSHRYFLGAGEHSKHSRGCHRGRRRRDAFAVSCCVFDTRTVCDPIVLPISDLRPLGPKCTGV